MISLILPYWDRQLATDEALQLMAEHYRHLDLEIIVIDDGSPLAFSPLPSSLSVTLGRLPAKNNPLNPCVPYNRGVVVSRGEYIALSNPEILHKRPVLEAMRDEIERGGDTTYVMAAAWCPEQKRWHAHSSRSRRDDNDVGVYVPRGADYHFMTMMRRELWDAAGGFDEDYRAGAGYDDPDFVRRLDRAGARFVMRDDLVVEHPRRGAHAAWTAAMFARNRALFMSKWQPLEERAA